MIKDNLDRVSLRPTRIIHDHGRRHWEERTVIVLGSGRGGTSMVAGALTILGVPMNGSQLDFVEGEYNGEDFEILAAIVGRPVILQEGRNPILGPSESGTLDERIQALTRVIEARNAASPLWGFKDPEAFTYLDAIRSTLRNPIIIAVFRDFAAIAEREFVSNGLPVEVGLGIALARYTQILNILERWSVPSLIVSLERSMTGRAAFISELAQFVGLADDRNRQTLAEVFIDPLLGYKDLRKVLRSTS